MNARLTSLGMLALAAAAATACGGDDDVAPDGSVDVDGGTDLDGGSPVDGSGSDGGGLLDGSFGIDGGPATPRDPFDGIGTVELVRGGFMFLEGPHWRAADGVLLFSDIPPSQIWQLTPPDVFEVFRDPSNESNGLASDPSGNLLAAEHAARRVSRTLADGTIEAVAERYMGMLLNSPNDLVVRSDSMVYFTDPPYGLGTRTREVPFNGVYRVALDGSLVAEWMGPMASRPNGIALSPDERTLYVADTAAGLVRAYDVATDGTLSGERTFADATPSADGMGMDETGNLYVTTSGGVKVHAPDGSVWGTIDIPMQPANCGFGDDDRQTLYVTARTALYRVRIPIRGL